MYSWLKMGKGQPAFNIFVVIKVKFFFYLFILCLEKFSIQLSLASNYCYECEKAHILPDQYIYLLNPQP